MTNPVGIEERAWSNARREVGRDARDGVQKSEVRDQTTEDSMQFAADSRQLKMSNPRSAI